jgi:hypothetical protein
MEGRRHMFPIVAVHLEDSNKGTGLNKSLLSEIKEHLICLKEKISRYFLDIQNKLCPSVKCPFTFDAGEIQDIAEEELISMMEQA